ncbi:MAG TPA: autotransporter outer membrane beta-barrel domain-containing protein, partial [Devosia sp.]|nr:autotransporter outer membrane beta-barrel domain-containing protein [Devosia sp.]
NGLISLIDNGVGDSLWIDHNFQGQADHSFIGLDVNFAAATPENPNGNFWGSPPDTWRSDRFMLGETHSEDVADGSTGLIIHKTGSGSDTVGDTILVGNVANVGVSPNSEDGGCVGDACKDGDTFYIASASQGYLDVGGIGAVQDGMYAWYLTQQQNTGEDGGSNFVLESDWSPQSQSLGGLLTAGQILWYDTSEAPLNHGGTGPSGADLGAGQTPAPASGVSAWAKAVGSYFSRTSSATTGAPPVTFDTSLVQDTFGLLAGADVNPGDTSGIRGGAFGGLIGSSMTLGFGASATYMGGTAGLYASYVPDTTSGVFVDGEVKADLLGVSYSAPGAFSATGTMTSVGVTGDAGYKVDAGNNMYVAPVASLSLVDTMLSGFSAGGGTASFSNGLSIRPGIGIEVGTTVAAGDGMSADLSVSAKLVDELGAANTVTLSDGVNPPTSFGDSITGPFAELSANGTLYTSDPTLQVFGSSGLKTNGSFVDVNAKVGVKKSF